MFAVAKSTVLLPKIMKQSRQMDWPSPGGVRTPIALHHGRKMKNKSFASCRGRVNISGSSKIA